MKQHGRDVLTAELARRSHRSPTGEATGTCLRYHVRFGTQRKRARRLANTLLREGLTARLGARIPRILYRWRLDYENRYHRRGLAAERVSLLSRSVRGFDGWLLRLNAKRVEHALARRWRERLEVAGHAGVALRRGLPIRSKDVRRLRRIWVRYRSLTLSAYEISREIPAQETTTARRMKTVIDLLKRWIAYYGEPPVDLGDLPLDGMARTDGFGVPLEYEVAPETVRVLSPGFDGLAGTADDQLRGFTWP
ncbi:MAG: hypothetical protein KAI47_22590 [Deltaproteobacteria bacterium]|nr:hypothetical protein [Deltaproteobacteria bacterium]